MNISLETKIEYLDGVGPKSAMKLNKLGIETVYDLIFYYPRQYRDFTSITKIGEIGNFRNEAVTIRGTIIGIHNKRTSRRRFTVTEAVVEDGSGSIKIVWFNQPFLAKMLTVGREVILNGKIEYNFYSKEVVMESPERTLRPMIVPVYSETAGISSKYISKLVESIKYKVENIEEWLPEHLLRHPEFISGSQKDGMLKQIQIPKQVRDDARASVWHDKKGYNLLPIQDALLNIHTPKSSEMLDLARRRLAFDELFLIALRANLSRLEIKKETAPAISTDDKKVAYAEFLSSLPYELTGDQKKATEQILKDIEKNVPMNRLLNGDVGSGKTVVAAIAAYVAVKAGFRVAVMCPTSILASQHFETFTKLFEKLNINVGLYTRERHEFSCRHPVLDTGSRNYRMDSGSLATGRNDDRREQNHNSSFIIHNSNIIIGTQALIQKGVRLENLGLVIVDEQHRFGVNQRAALQQLVITKKQDTITSKIPNSKLKTINYQLQTAQKMRPHFLSMTATPIPRTLHLALFGDLDISVIKEKPKDRKEIKTRLVEPQNREKAYQFIKAHINAGRQAFIICPLIEDNEISTENQSSKFQALNLFEQDRKSVKAEYEKLGKIFPDFKIGMLHGKMKSKEKDEIMKDFAKNKINILVSTSVVEVGIDIPNATVMIVEDAERFGLAQIHQFRGRVGRAEHQSFCFLFSPTISEKAINRLKALESTSDGFALAEIDLEARGPGAVFGTEQSGMLDLKMANFSDRMLVEEASSAAKSIVEKDPKLKKYPILKQKIADTLNNQHME